MYKERNFEDSIESHLLASGYQPEPSASFNTALALFPEVLFEFLESTQPEEVQQLKESVGDVYRDVILSRIHKECQHKGLIAVFRKGITVKGLSFRLAYFQPASGNNPELERWYRSNRLTVTRQLFYGGTHNNSLDMVLALNGFPVVTLELKNTMTGQTVHHAMLQYKQDRNPKELIFHPNCRSLVHFAVDTEEVYMTTHLRKERTFFLPFNRGNQGGKGNMDTPGDYKTSYLWNDVLQPANLLEIINRFVHKHEDKIIFPRYHQWDVVRKLTTHAKMNGSGHHYLIQHSAGSGKSNSIAWLSHRLSSLHDSENLPVFDSVIVITDRRALDRQLKETVLQFERTQGVIQWAENASSELANYIQNGTKIIITTLQKFPHALKLMKNSEKRRYAIIIDEAHSSQSGEAANSVRQSLSGYDLIEDAIERELLSQGKHNHLSFFAFTATPKKSTLEVFGTREGYSSKPEPFHVYSMRQAIEEGFILNVLDQYTSYNVYYNVIKKTNEDPDVNKRRATREIAHYVARNPETIAQKTKIMIEHFIRCSKHKIGGQAKAMVVTSSREQAVLYKLAFDEYLAKYGHQDMKAIVAFSGSIRMDESSKECTERNMNGFSDSELPKRFSQEPYRFLIVANKYQTGFDQPLLHTMYVDKRISGINCVQTLSRLNRTHPGKNDTFILDFANSPDDIRKSFQPYFEWTTIDELTDPDILFDIKDKLEEYPVYYSDEVEQFAEWFYCSHEKGMHQKMDALVTQSKGRFLELSPDDQVIFKACLSKYVYAYNYITQLLSLPSRELLQLFVFGKRLQSSISHSFDVGAELLLDEKVDLARLNITLSSEEAIDLEIKRKAGEVTGGPDLTTITVPDEEKSSLSLVIENINERFGENFTESGFGGFIHQLVEDSMVDETLVSRAKNNKFNEFYKNSFTDSLFIHLLDQRKERNNDAFDKILNNEELSDLVKNHIANEIYKLAKNQEN